MFPDINAGPDLVFLLQKQLTDSEGHNTHESRQIARNNRIVIISQVSTLFITLKMATYSHTRYN